MVIATRHLLK